MVPFYVSFDEGIYLKEKTDISVRDFYKQMVERVGVFPKTSMPSTNDYLDYFIPLAEKGIDILCLCITTKFSGSFNSANAAKDICKEKYPNARIEVVNTMVNTVLQGMLVKEVCLMKRDGLSLDEILTKIEEIKTTGRIFFTVNGLEYLHHGGRIGKLKAIIGSVLKVNPLIILRDGEIFSSGVSLSRKRALVKIREIALEHFAKENLCINDYKFSVGFGYDYEESAIFRNKLATDLGVDPKDILIEQIGATISVHTGPYPLGIGILKKYK